MKSIYTYIFTFMIKSKILAQKVKNIFYLFLNKSDYEEKKLHLQLDQ